MKPDPKIFDDLSRVAGGALNVFSAFREQILGDIKARVDEAASRMDLVPREDLERLELRVAALEKQLKAPSAATPKKTVKATAKKPAAKKTISKTGNKKK